MSPTEFLTLRLEDAGLLAPVVGLLVGVALTLAPISWPTDDCSEQHPTLGR